MEGRGREGSQGGGEKSEASISSIEPNSMYMLACKHQNNRPTSPLSLSL